MKNEMNLMRHIRRHVATMGTASLLLLASPAFSQQGATTAQQPSAASQTPSATTQTPAASQTGNQGTVQDRVATPGASMSNMPEFAKLDQDRNQNLDWNELQKGLKDKLEQNTMDRQQVMNQFDTNRDSSLTQTEYSALVTELQKQEQTAQSSQQQQLTPQSAGTSAEQQRSASQQNQIVVEQPQPQVTVQQPKPQVTVTQPQPQVTVTQPQPEVEVVQAEPEVTVEQPEPNVQVTQPDPEVMVQQQEPEVNVQQAQGADVTVEQQEPEVSVQQRQTPATGLTQERQEADVAATEPRETQDPQSVEDIERMPATAAGVPQDRSAATKSFYDTSIDQLDNRKVLNESGQEIGQIDRVVRAKQGGEVGVVISVGGFMGTQLGDQKVFASADDLKMAENGVVWQTAKAQQEIKNSAQFNDDRYEEVSSDQYRTLREVKQKQQ